MLHARVSDLLSKIEHTCLKPSASEQDIQKLCREAIEHQFFGVCVAGTHLALARKELANSRVQLVTVVGFPHGNNHSLSKRDELKILIAEGAHEVDVVMNWAALKEGRESFVLDELNLLSQTAGDVPLKLIIETSELTHSQKRLACELAQKANLAFVKTSTGFASSGAIPTDISLMRATVGPMMGIKASGGIKTWAQAKELIAAGANRIGASSSISILEDCKKEADAA